MERRQEKLTARYKDVVLPTVIEKSNLPELPFYNFVSGFSHPILPIVKHDGIFLYEWGLIPDWVKNFSAAKEIQTKTLNAVGETVFEKPSFRKSILSQRCLLCTSGFYEWRDVNKKKYPYFIKLNSNEIFSLGCIFENWIDKTTGEVKNTFSILTTAANPLMEKIHNLKKRMPLIISRSEEKNWIDPSINKEEILSMIKPFPQQEMNAYTISQNANSAKNNRDVNEIITQVNYPELDLPGSEQFLF